ncbi:MAG: hypothetical protein FWG11_08915 [Promicromonosporaceae bacterium]|nr:hypothetical protein [Promicromonosporaceae bacterium]
MTDTKKQPTRNTTRIPFAATLAIAAIAMAGACATPQEESTGQYAGLHITMPPQIGEAVRVHRFPRRPDTETHQTYDVHWGNAFSLDPEQEGLALLPGANLVHFNFPGAGALDLGFLLEERRRPDWSCAPLEIATLEARAYFCGRQTRLTPVRSLSDDEHILASRVTDDFIIVSVNDFWMLRVSNVDLVTAFGIFSTISIGTSLDEEP